MTDYSFVKCRIAKENIGEHDADNRFLYNDPQFLEGRQPKLSDTNRGANGFGSSGK